jgi:Ca2+-binding RTX toxin-like protein
VPQFDAGPDAALSSSAGGVLLRTIQFTDPGDDFWTGSVDFGDGTGLQTIAIQQLTKTLELAHTFTGSGPFSVSVTIDDQDGEPQTDTFLVTFQRSGPTFVTVEGPDNGVAGQSLMYIAQTLDSSDQLSWEVLDAAGNVLAIGSGSHFAYTPMATGVQTVRVTALDSSGQSASEAITLSVSSLGVVEGDLYVAGTSGNDDISIVAGGDGTVQVYQNGQVAGVFDGVTGEIIVNGFGGDDRIDVSQQVELPTLIFAGDGNDTVTGGSGPDQINGGAGRDLIYGGNGSDVLIGAEEADIIFGGNGTDWIDGGDGDDQLFGDNGKDTLIGGQGADQLSSGNGQDLLVGLETQDLLLDDQGKPRPGGLPAPSPQDGGGGKKDKKK